MDFCFEKFVGFKRIVLDVALKNSLLFLITSNYMNTGATFNLFVRQKKYFMKKIMKLTLDEVNMSDRHDSDGQTSFWQLFSNAEKIRLN